MGSAIAAAVVLFFALLVLITLAKTVRIIPQARAGIVERLGRYQRTLNPGLTILVPFVDQLKPLIDLREQVVSFPPQPVITEDNLVVGIDTVIYFQVTDPKAATYEIANYIQGVEQLTVTTLRNVVGGLNLEETLTSRDQINAVLRGVLDEATGKWGIRVNRVELKAIDPPHSVQDSMEKQMRAERDRRAAILTAEGVKASAILTAEGQRQSAILKAEGDAQAAVLRANGESQAIAKVFDAIHAGNPDGPLLAYQYLQTLPQIAQGDANKVWVIPAELNRALESIGGALGGAVPSVGSTQAAAGQPSAQPTSSPPQESRQPAQAAAASLAAAAQQALTAAPQAPREAIGSGPGSDVGSGSTSGATRDDLAADMDSFARPDAGPPAGNGASAASPGRATPAEPPG